ncbi:DUF494 family protein [Thiohalospira sp.]|uniref:DUF494 family protein n=1 Tax=Thiohalospira sp. TaxID=3080549 RepID=UPI0039814456
MKENVLDVLMYLFENYLYDEDLEVEPDEDSLRTELGAAGFRRAEIDKALSWLEGLVDLQEDLDDQPRHQSIRLFTEPECEKMDTEARGFLLYLEQAGVLDQASREMVIDRVMALDAGEIDLDQLKWVVLMVLFNLPGQEAAFAWMEDLVFNEMAGHLH